MSSIRAHLSKEVKKRGAIRLAIDVSYKEAKKLCRVGGKAVYVGLVTGLNEVGEVRLQFHIVSDSHEQMRAAFEAFKKTAEAYGLPPLEVYSTDNPSGDSRMAKEVFPSLSRKQDELDQLTPSDVSTAQSKPSLPLLGHNPYDVRVVQSAGEINSAIAAIKLVSKHRRVGLHCEWRVERDARNRVVKIHSIGCIQLGYFDKTKNRYRSILIFTNKLKKQGKPLPASLLNLFEDKTVALAGVNIKGDINKLCKDFGATGSFQKRGGENLFDLGEQAARRGVIPNRNVGLQKLCELLLRKRLLKNQDALYSNWDTENPDPIQIRYVLFISLNRASHQN